MLEHVPHWLGSLLHNVRAGHSKLVIVQEGVVTNDARLDLSSLAFADGGRLPPRFTADGEGVSPPLSWSGVPDGTAALALIVEDPDAPTPNPLVHAVVWNIAPDTNGLPEGAIAADGPGSFDGSDVGRNSYRQEGWLPPDPPTGHGSHDYVFQLFALREAAPLDINPGRSEVLAAIRGAVLAAGMLVGTYSRGEEAPVGPAGAAQTA
ncbi:YbhB/YbcL family Raf kinase inhibitor-like protein [Sphingomonas endophytica]|uniref:Phosphatidylethanolamine-binding protein n=1 Tax=Sphingomonas endophytica TaxID=869719 RepID=A0A147HW80_9SPHN|nr:YbhB/YbcL family Raf kinase inhibitor-like protein [Sphingomonas endophytica]KTT69190.1 phosphatidylethanolamine-binding protein [Sphingomonas endophytica]